jgi:exodeoxyribonuclease V alpha subunit
MTEHKKQRLILIRGKPGSGKSTIARKLANDIGAIYISADHYFQTDKGYKRDPKKQGKAHEWCQEKARQLISTGKSVVIANTFPRRYDMRYYEKLAKDYNVIREYREAKGDFKSIHKVPESIINDYVKNRDIDFSQERIFKGFIIRVPFINSKKVIFQIEIIPSKTNLPTNKRYAEAHRKLITNMPLIGEYWKLKGFIKPDKDYWEILTANLCERIWVSGREVRYFLEKSSQFPGWDQKKIEKLHSEFGTNLGKLLDEQNILKLSESSLGIYSVYALLQEWEKCYEKHKILRWFDKYKIEIENLDIIYEFWGSKTIQKLEKDPYRLLPFTTWKKVDALAERLKIPKDCNLRYLGAIEWVCYKHYENKNTAVKLKVLENELFDLIGCNYRPEKMLNDGWRARLLNTNHEIKVQSSGAFKLENYVQNEILTRIEQNKKQNGKNKLIFNSKTNKLNRNQKNAVKLVLENSISCIIVEPGSEKKIVLNAILEQLKTEQIFQITFKETAAKQMTICTGKPAENIYSFLKIANKFGLPENCWVFADQSSMFDIICAFEFLKTVPKSAKICFIGDPYQLPPNGPGMFFNILANTSKVPKIRLKENSIGGNLSEIPKACKAISSSKTPKISKYKKCKNKINNISFAQTNEMKLIDTLLPIYREFSDMGKIQIIAAKTSTREKINDALHNEYKEAIEYNSQSTNNDIGLNEIRLRDISKTNGKIEIFAGEPILWKGINQYEREISNGSLGKISEGKISEIQPLQPPQILENTIIAKAEIDGKEIELYNSDIEFLELGYAINATESKGYEFSRIIVIVEDTGHNGIIDNSWIYTAISRGKEEVVLIGDRDVFKRETKKASRSFDRVVGLTFK